MSAARTTRVLLALAAALLALALLAAVAGAQELSDDGNASWRLEQPKPPPPPVGVAPSEVPIGLGPVGDIQFWGPNRGLLITAGNPKSIPPGIWVYNGVGWHELANVCGATDGRIAWAGPDDFWTISDGRPGQAIVENKVPPTTDNTLCHFVDGHVVASYAAPAFQADSYVPMHAAACISESDCWFAGDPLPTSEPGAFQLHWNGSTLKAEPNPQGHAVEDMRAFEGSLFEGVLIRPSFSPPQPEREDKITEVEPPGEPSDLHTIAASGAFRSLESANEVPIYTGENEPPWALQAPHLGSDGEALWAAVDPLPREAFPPEKENLTPQEVTIVRDSGGTWSQAIGTLTDASEPGAVNPFTKSTEKGNEAANEVVSSIAAEPGSEDAWLALRTAGSLQNSNTSSLSALVARVGAGGAVGDHETLPDSAEAQAGVGPKGGASKVVCPAAHDCWMVTTQGWLFHLADAAERVAAEEHAGEDTDPSFTGFITERPEDEGLPQTPPDAPPADDSGLPGEAPSSASLGEIVKSAPVNVFATVTLPLLSHLHSRLVHGTTLELSFHLAVKARLRLLAKRHSRIVASTPTKTLAAGNRKLLLLLNVHRWPTKIELKEHPLAPLPTTSTRSANTETVSTSLLFPKALRDTPLGLPF